MKILTNEELARLVPGAEAVNRNVLTTSDRYKFISTMDMIQTVRNTGWQPVRAFTVKSRTRAVDFAKHLIVFRQEAPTTELARVGDTVPEIVLTNAHDGSASFAFMLGLFRLICSNGLIVSSGIFESFKIRHNATSIANVIDVVAETVDRIPRVQETVKTLQSIPVTQDEARVYAESAAKMRWDNAEVTPDTVERLLVPARTEDARSQTVWQTYNTVQERLVGRSGTRLTMRDTQTGESRRRTVRAVKGLDENVRLNRGLFHLAVEMAKLKGAQL